MARVRIRTEGKKQLGSVSVPLRITDLNYGNHVGNDSIVSLIHQARVLWLATLGFTEFDVDGASLIQADLEVSYKQELFYPDMLAVDLFAGDISSAGFEILYHLKNNAGETIALAKTGIVFFDYESRSVMAMPEAFRQILN